MRTHGAAGAISSLLRPAGAGLLCVAAAACGGGGHGAPKGSVDAASGEVFLTESVTLTAHIDRNAGGSGYTVPVLSSNPGVVSVPASITIPAGADSVDFEANGVTVGGPVEIDVQFPSGTATANVTVLPVPSVTLVAVTTSADQLSTGSLMIDGTASHARALDPSAVTVGVPAGSGITLGTPSLTGDETGFEITVPFDVAVDAPEGPVAVDVDTNGPDLGGSGSVSLTVDRIPRVAMITPATRTIDTTELHPFLVTLDQPARAQGEQVVLASGDPGTVGAPAMVVVSAGLMSAVFDLEGVAPGGPIDVSAMLADSTSMTAVTVQDATITAPNVTSGGSGYPGDTISLTATGIGSSDVALDTANFTLTAPAMSGLTIMNATLSGDVTGWTLTADVVIDAAAPAATVNLDFDANGATPGSMQTIPFTVNALPTVTTVGPDGTTLQVGSNGMLTVTLDHPARAEGESVALSSDSGAVTVPATATVAAGMTQGTFQITAAGEGSATITASLNGGSDTTTVTTYFVQQGAMTITEFVTLTVDTSSNAGEAIELWNNSGSPQAINGWFVATTSSGTMSIRNVSAPTDETIGLVIPSGGFAYGVPNPASAASIPPGATFVYGDPGVAAQIGNAGDRLRLLSTPVVLQDEVDFRNIFVSDGAVPLAASDFAGSSAHSTQLSGNFLDPFLNDDGANWCTTFHVSDTLGTANQTCDEVLVNEVLYDAAAGDDGNVFVELAGNGGADIAGFHVHETNSGGTSFNNATIPTGQRMPSDGFYVIADALSSGVTNVANADQSPKTWDPTNTDGASVQLLDAGLVVLDAVQYGMGTQTNGEGTPTLIINTAGNAIARDANSTDTNDNSVDFTEQLPTPGVANP